MAASTMSMNSCSSFLTDCTKFYLFTYANMCVCLLMQEMW